MYYGPDIFSLKQQNRAGTVVQQIKFLLAISVSHISVLFQVLATLLLIQTLLILLVKAVEDSSSAWTPVTHIRDRGFWLLALAFPQTG